MVHDMLCPQSPHIKFHGQINMQICTLPLQYRWNKYAYIRDLCPFGEFWNSG